MREKTQVFIKSVYRMWKRSKFDPAQAHPDAAVFACFFDGGLSQEESREFKRHIVLCETCAEKAAAAVPLDEAANIAVAPGRLRALKKLLSERIIRDILEISLLLKEGSFELLNTTGEVLSGGEFIPEAVLRSARSGKTRHELIVRNDFKGLRLEVRIENKRKRTTRVSVLLKDSAGRKALRKDVRVTLSRAGVELESYCVDSGRACFEDVAAGSYTAAIAVDNKIIATVVLNMRLA
ncbi:MAG: hypothetical protein WC695_10475 [Candidatus Omnitrophota bacterium]